MSSKTFVGFVTGISPASSTCRVGTAHQWEFPVAKNVEIPLGSAVYLNENGTVSPAAERKCGPDPRWAGPPVVYYPAKGCKACGTRPGANYCHQCGRESNASIARRIADSVRGESIITIPHTGGAGNFNGLHKVDQMPVPRINPSADDLAEVALRWFVAGAIIVSLIAIILYKLQGPLP